MTTNKSLDECVITWIIDKSKQEVSAFADSVETILVQLNKEREKELQTVIKLLYV